MFGKILRGALLLFTLMATSQAAILWNAGYIPHRVYHADEKKFSDFETMLMELSKADVVFVGEQHDDAATHGLELAILEGLARRRGSIIVAMEMFERDVQAPLDEYLAGKISEADFLKVARPWPNYASDYRPLIEFAKRQGWRVIAGNAPRKYASQVGRGGLAALDKMPPNERRFLAAEINAPKDDYFKKFGETMKSHPGAAGEKKSEAEEREMTERFYLSQCVKDDTMAESIAKAIANSGMAKPLVVHFNGSFHSDYHWGTAARTHKRLPKARIEVVSVVPLEQLDTIAKDEYRKRGDYIVFALRPAQTAEKK